MHTPAHGGVPAEDGRRRRCDRRELTMETLHHMYSKRKVYVLSSYCLRFLHVGILSTLSLLSLTSGYRRTRQFMEEFLPKMGVAVDVIDMSSSSVVDELEALLGDKSKKPVSLFFSETPTNPFLRCIDVPKVCGNGTVHNIAVRLESIKIISALDTVAISTHLSHFGIITDGCVLVLR